jgi:hypothetical protein
MSDFAYLHIFINDYSIIQIRGFSVEEKKSGFYFEESEE